MPHIPLINPESVGPQGSDSNPYRVLITGFGPFASYTENPSWLAVRELHNVLLELDTLEIEPVTVDNQVALGISRRSNLRPIHVTALEVPVSYSAVLSAIPGLHARPPVLPDFENSSKTIGGGSTRKLAPDPPAEGYDFILHVGAGRPGGLRVERLGHKSGYYNPDVDGKYAPVIDSTVPALSPDETQADVFEQERLGSKGKESKKNRGFGKEYDEFSEELTTKIDVDSLIQSLNTEGFLRVEPSSNAGHYLCDFIYYCSLAEALKTQARRRQPSEPDIDDKDTKVLFIHCPPVGHDLFTGEVTDALKRVIMAICTQDL